MTLLTEARQAARRLSRTPGFTAVTVGTLALGIGATAAIFSVVRGVLLEPLPYPAGDRIVQLWQLNDDGGQVSWSEPNFQDITERSRSFAVTAAYQRPVFTVLQAGDAERVAGAAVSEGFFEAIGVRPVQGRLFAPDDFRQAAPVVVVSHGFWQSQLGGDPEVVGRTLRVGQQSLTVVGVLPPRQEFPAATRLWVPRMTPEEPSRTAHNWNAIARLHADVSPDAANREVASVAERLKEQLGDDTWMASAEVVPLHTQLVGGVRAALLILLAAAVLLLLIACANAANLLLARAAHRQRELAVRLALGAGRSGVLRQSLAESLILALVAGLAGVLLAFWAVEALLALEPGRLPRLDAVSVNWIVLAVSLGVAAAAAVGMGLLTTLRATRTDVGEVLAKGGRSGTAGLAAGRLRGALVAAQVALTLVLLVGAGLLSRSFLRLVALDPGYRTSGALTLDLASLPAPDGPGDDPLFLAPPNPRAAGVLTELMDRLGSLPGAEAVGGINTFPLKGGGGDGQFLVLERPDEVQSMEDWARLSGIPGRTGYAEYRIATPGYFEAMAIPLLSGRSFDRTDVPGRAHAAVISESLAEAQWPGEDPLGKLIQFANMDGIAYPLTVVGVVGDVRDLSLEAEPRPTLYGNALQRTTRIAEGMHLVVTSSGPPARLVTEARSIVRELAPNSPVQLLTLDEIFSASLAQRRFSLVLLGAFGLSALLLAGLGIYGVVSYMVAQRSREMGIRIALGAERLAVLRLVVWEGLLLTLVGLLAGAVIAAVATRVLSAQLYGVEPLDPLTFIGVGLVLALATVAASYGPARRATRVDPMVALRQE